MRLFLDTANLEEIREINRWGVLSGITTNPTLVSKENEDPEALWKEILAEVAGLPAVIAEACREWARAFESVWVISRAGATPGASAADHSNSAARRRHSAAAPDLFQSSRLLRCESRSQRRQPDRPAEGRG